MNNIILFDEREQLENFKKDCPKLSIFIDENEPITIEKMMQNISEINEIPTIQVAKNINDFSEPLIIKLLQNKILNGILVLVTYSIYSPTTFYDVYLVGKFNVIHLLKVYTHDGIKTINKKIIIVKGSVIKNYFIVVGLMICDTTYIPVIKNRFYGFGNAFYNISNIQDKYTRFDEIHAINSYKNPSVIEFEKLFYKLYYQIFPRNETAFSDVIFN